MHMYALIHQNEKPCNLDNVKVPFMNSSDLLQLYPELNHVLKLKKEINEGAGDFSKLGR